MVMTALLQLISGARTRVANLSDDAGASQSFEDAVNRGPRNLRQPLADIVKNLVGGGMIRAQCQSMQNFPPLGGNRQAALAADILELFQLEGRCRNSVHVL